MNRVRTPSGRVHSLVVVDGRLVFACNRWPYSESGGQPTDEDVNCLNCLRPGTSTKDSAPMRRYGVELVFNTAVYAEDPEDARRLAERAARRVATANLWPGRRRPDVRVGDVQPPA